MERIIVIFFSCAKQSTYWYINLYRYIN